MRISFHSVLSHMVRRIGKDVQETVVAKLEVLYTKLPKGRPQKA